MNCVAESCDRPSRARGRCERHYKQWWTARPPGSVLPMGAPPRLQPGSARHRILALIDIDGGWMTKAMVTADFEMRWPDIKLNTIERAYHRLTNTDWVETRMVVGNVRVRKNGDCLVYQMRTLDVVP